MKIESEYLDVVNQAKREGYEPIARVQVYFNPVGIVYHEGGIPYLLAKSFGNLYRFKIASKSGLYDIASIGKRKIEITDEEYVVVDSMYETNDERYLFKNPYWNLSD